MDQVLKTKPPYFDPHALRHELTALARETTGDEHALRAEVLQRLKAVLDAARTAASEQLAADGRGRQCAFGLSQMQDELISVIYDFTVHHVYRAKNPSDAERMGVVATGGYGRGLLAPGSDIDLLFLLPYKQTAWGESVVEYMLYVLWDLGQKVGHATRTVDQCVRLARSDMTIRTALLDARLILGDAALFADFEDRFAKEVVQGSNREFIEAKLEERARWHASPGASRYMVEPNVKEGKGGLRDLHTLHWVAKYLHPNAEEDFVAAGVFTGDEYHTYRKCEDFLWTVRCHLHFLTGRAEERLTFDVQPEMAERLGYRGHAGLRTVERFMKHYFLVAKDVGDLTRVVCSALEVQQLKSTPSLGRFLSPVSWRRRAKVRRTSAFRIENGRIALAEADGFERDPVNLIRLFWLAERNDVLLHPEVVRQAQASSRLNDRALRRSPEANRLFMKLLTETSDPAGMLRNMNEAGVLGRFVLEFGRVVSMMQFNMYHHYTVDEHLIRTVGALAGIEHGRLKDDHPVSSDIIGSIENRHVLYLAAFLHDIAKGRKEDHSIAGARVAERLGPRFGLTPGETGTLAWLIRQHLTMSFFAQSRDLNDPKTIRDFADIVQTRERLKMLLVLTCADIRSVGPGVWNNWKGSLLRGLYFETEPLLAGGHTRASRSDRVEAAQAELFEALGEWPRAKVQAFIDRQYAAYWLKGDTSDRKAHAELVAKAEADGKTVATDVSTDAFTGATRLAILAPNHPRLLAMIAGACAASGANIVDAQINTTRDGLALDDINVRREFDRADDEMRRGHRIAATVEQLMRGEARLSGLLAGKRKVLAKQEAFTVHPEVVIDNTLSDELTVIEVAGLDRPGLLHELTTEISDLKLDIASAHIATFGEKAVDVFYVTDLIGNKITNRPRQTAIRHRLTAILAAGNAAVSEAAQ